MKDYNAINNKRVHFPPDAELTNVHSGKSQVPASVVPHSEEVATSSHLCGKFSSPFRVGVSST